MGGTKRDIIKAYETLGGRIYDIRYTEEQETKYQTLLERSCPEVTEVVLDVGCGTGLLLNKLRSHNVGLDISPGLLLTARSRIVSQSRDVFVQADAENLPFRSRVFHRLYSVTLIQNTPNPGKAIMEMRRVSRKGSKLAITALKKAFSKEQFEYIFKSEGFQSVSFVSIEELKDWVAIVCS